MPVRASLEEAGVAHGSRAHDHRVRTGRQPCVHRLGGPHATCDLDFKVAAPHDRLDHAAVVTRPARGIEVDHVDVFGAGDGKLFRHVGGIVGVHLWVVEVATHQPHAAAAEDVDRGDDYQGPNARVPRTTCSW